MYQYINICELEVDWYWILLNVFKWMQKNCLCRVDISKIYILNVFILIFPSYDSAEQREATRVYTELNDR